MAALIAAWPIAAKQARHGDLHDEASIPQGPPGSAAALEEFLHLGEEAGAFWVGRVRGFGGELRQELALAPRQVLRRLDNELNEEIPGIARAKHRHALGPQPQLAPRLGAFRDADLGFGPIER